MTAVTFVIVNWNGRELLADCLKSIYSQSFADFEVIVVDNGSTDGTRDFLAQQYPRVRMILLDRNHGFARPNNLAFQQAQGEFIATVNNDVTLDAQWLELLHNAIRRDPTCFAAQGKIVRADHQETVDTCGLGMRPCGAARNLAHNRPASSISKEREIFTVSAGAAIYRKSMLQELQYFDERYFAYYEDLDLGWRARQKNWHALLIPEAIARHKIHGTSGQLKGDFLWFLSERNRLRTLYKNLPASVLLRHPMKLTLDELRYIDMIRKKAKWATLLKARAAVLADILSFRIRRTNQGSGTKEWNDWLSLSME